MSGKAESALPDLLVTAARVRQMCGDVSESTLRLWVRAGKIPPPMQIGRRFYWKPEVIAGWLERSQVRAGSPAS